MTVVCTGRSTSSNLNEWCGFMQTFKSGNGCLLGTSRPSNLSNLAHHLAWVISASTAGLFRFCYPAAIGWTVRAIVVKPFNGMVWRWSRAHVTDPIRDRVEPALANGDATSAVPLVRFVVWIVAARNHHAPYAIKRMTG